MELRQFESKPKKIGLKDFYKKVDTINSKVKSKQLKKTKK